MASRHNRKRTRSRPRNRNGRRQQFQFASNDPPMMMFNNNDAFWPVEQQLQQQQQQRLDKIKYDAAMLEAEHIRVFGGEVGDDSELCPKMLSVVMGLFGGNVDYLDP